MQVYLKQNASITYTISSNNEKSGRVQSFKKEFWTSSILIQVTEQF